ncbi:MAG: methyl-accepting chemotaxis protein [Hyphomonadaceae bacterium]|nr:MAG: methyl-accepting chemotaxis protein [Hyphomonadaceae bacterium]
MKQCPPKKEAAFLEEGLTTLSSTSQELQANACQMGAMASQTENLTQEATRASSNASEGVNSIASATTQLTANVEQIAQQMQRSAIIANEASQTSRDTGEAVKALATAVTEISEVVSLIDEVAAQTNLLALNATIEAARAGEAGRGFAVVASEVKGLAAQTATATQDIEHRIGRIKEASRHVAQSVSRVIEMVEEMQELANASSDAVHEQSGATALIAESASVASQGTSEANEHVVILSNSKLHFYSVLALLRLGQMLLRKKPQAVQHGQSKARLLLIIGTIVQVALPLALRPRPILVHN